jgi:hypothetical protein
MLKEIMGPSELIEQSMNQMKLNEVSSKRSPQSNSPNRTIVTPPSTSPSRMATNYGSPIPMQQYLSQSPSSSVGSFRPTSQFSSPMQYGSPQYGSPHHQSSMYGQAGQLPPPYSQMPWQTQAPAPPPKPNSYQFSRDMLPRGEIAEQSKQFNQANSNTEQFVQMGFNAESVIVARRIYTDEQSILDFLFIYEELTRQGHDSEAVEELISLVGLSDKSLIQAILTNVPYLREMGFQPKDCAEALYSTKNDKEAALDLLLNKNA